MLNQINPDFIRFRTLTIQLRMPLHNDVASGEFVRATDEEIIKEEKLLIENLNCNSQIVSDHMINLLPEVEGRLPEDKEKMLAIIRCFQSLSSEERDIYKLGRRLGLFNRLDDLNDDGLRQQVEGVLARLGEDGVSDELLFSLMERYV